MEHLIVTSADAAKLVPYARGRVRALRAAGLQYITQRYPIEGYQVRVTLSGSEDIIEIRGGMAGYEFWVNDSLRIFPNGVGSEGHIHVKGTDADGVEIAGETPSDFATGHAVHLTHQGKARARYSTSIVPKPDGPKWPLVSPRRLTTVTPSNGTMAEPGWFFSKWSWQDQKMFEHSWWKGNKGGWLLTSAMGTNYGLATNAPSRGPGTTAYSYRSSFLLRMGGDRQADPLMSASRCCATSPTARRSATGWMPPTMWPRRAPGRRMRSKAWRTMTCWWPRWRFISGRARALPTRGRASRATLWAATPGAI